MKPVLLPILGANMSHGIVRRWIKQEGDTVRIGDPLFEVETDKVNAEVEAEAEGVLRRIVASAGTRVAALGVVAFVGAPDEAIPEILAQAEPATAAPGGPATSRPAHVAPPEESGRSKASPAARKRARELGVSIDDLRGSGARGEVTRADVEDAARGGDGRLDEAFLASLRQDPGAFRSLSSSEKIERYRRHGARIGEEVRIDPGAIVIAREIVIGTASSIGADTTVECDTFRVGRLCAIGRRNRIHCRSIRIGDALWGKDDVTIGGGGSDEPEARLEIGDACFLGEGAYLNPCRPVTLGDEVCIGARAMLFTHSHWQSVLEGYASTFAPVRVEDHVFVGNNAFVFPGVTIGAGATVTVNSFVAVNVAPRTMVSGVPAALVRHIVRPSHEERVRMMREALRGLAGVLGQRGRSVRVEEEPEAITLEIDDSAVVRFAPAWPEAAGAPGVRRAVYLALKRGSEPDLADGSTLFDLGESRVYGIQDTLSDEVREFCRRRGIRFRPFAWRYGVGHFEGDRFLGRARR